jgi:hypothetical protein
VIGLAFAVIQPYIAEALKPPEPPPQKLSDTLAEAGDKFVARMINRMRGKPAQPATKLPPAPHASSAAKSLPIAATSLGLIAAVCGTLGWVRREDHRLAASAIVTGTVAVGWIYIVTALAIALAIVILVLLRGVFAG